MFTNDLTRRKILSGAMQISVGGAVLLTAAACGDSGSKVALCVDPDKLSSGEKSLRASLHYNAKSPDATKDCKGCSFWKVGDKPECGHCDILTGITEGPATAIRGAPAPPAKPGRPDVPANGARGSTV